MKHKTLQQTIEKDYLKLINKLDKIIEKDYGTMCPDFEPSENFAKLTNFTNKAKFSYGNL
jgi:hypothetical protein